MKETIQLEAKMNGYMIDGGQCLQQTVTGIAHLANCCAISRPHWNALQAEQCEALHIHIDAVERIGRATRTIFSRRARLVQSSLAAGHNVCVVDNLFFFNTQSRIKSIYRSTANQPPVAVVVVAAAFQ